MNGTKGSESGDSSSPLMPSECSKHENNGRTNTETSIIMPTDDGSDVTVNGTLVHIVENPLDRHLDDQQHQQLHPLLATTKDSGKHSSSDLPNGRSPYDQCQVRVSDGGGNQNFRDEVEVLVPGRSESRPTGFFGTVRSAFSSNRSQGRPRGRRTTLERLLIAVCAILAVVCTVFLWVAVYRSSGTGFISGFSGDICLTDECVKTAAYILEAMDEDADPCEDFFQYACGSWNDKHVIPEDRSSISPFEILNERMEIVLKRILERPFHKRDNEATKKAKLLYQSCMDLKQRKIIGDEPLKERIREELGGFPVTNKNWKPPQFSVEYLIGKLKKDYNEGMLMEQWVGPDDKNSSLNIIQLDQMKLGLPSREYYLGKGNAKYLEAYRRFMTDVAVLLGADEEYAQREMALVLQLETLLANASLPEETRHDTGELYRNLSLRELKKEVPDFKWNIYFNASLFITIGEDEPIVTYSLPYLKKMSKIISKTDRRIVHNLIIWHLVKELMGVMPDGYQEVLAEFKRSLLGINAHRGLWKTCVDITNKRMGMAVGAMYIQETFNHQSKETALEMIHTLREAFNELLEDNIWMDDETRRVAREKADAMNERIGYPDMLESELELEGEFRDLEIHPSKFLENIFAAMRYEGHRTMKKLREPVRKDRWSTLPAVVNAFYDPHKNDIVFPAGILQPNFYNPDAPNSLNYGGIGVVIGHEITHGFDDKGRQYDKDGNMKEWWNDETIRAFRRRAQCFVDTYSTYNLPLVNMTINGMMTQGENIADNGGLKQAFRAYKKWVQKNGPEQALPGLQHLTHEQLFFLNFAQIWCGSMTPEDAISKIRSAVHSPAPIRVQGPLSNSYDFAAAYNCRRGSRMNPPSKCSVW